ncbi:hypothetical protein PDE_04544 [Penicillium oxalicum 114-2]|uniref:Major facilitator superfamily (MFS) profile domain-containing protein n=2 Tax=Penicillium oxalicum TaxID=69781 RepID=S7ZH30_PENO1|nr:hypothetical protein PDE_04544 [Penicillium oxalicum 114-2]
MPLSVADEPIPAGVEKEAGPPVVQEIDPLDPALPQNWTKTRKWLVLIILSLMSLMVNMSLVICSPASSAMAQEFNNYNGFQSVFFITVPNLGEVIAPLYIGPLSERIGRMPVCHFFNFTFLIFTMIAGFSNSFAMVIVFRFLAGASVSSICLNPAITGDLFTKEERGSAMSLTSLIPILGTAVGPILGGYITQGLNWRWTFWLMAIVSAFLAIIMAAVLKESYVPVIRRKRLSKTSSGHEALEPRKKYLQGWSIATVKAVVLLAVRPFIILSQSRVGVLMGLYLALLFAYISLLAATMATVFQEAYGFTESQSGLIYIAMMLGTLSGALMCRFTLDYFLVRGLPFKRMDPEVPPRPENRLIPILPAMIAFPIGLFLYGWSLEERLHWIVPALATFLCGFSLSSSTTPIMNYLVDIFGDRSASAVAAVLPLRYVGGAFLPVAAPYMYARLGYGWGNSLLGFVLLIALPAPFLTVIRPRRAEPSMAVASSGLP